MPPFLADRHVRRCQIPVIGDPGPPTRAADPAKWRRPTDAHVNEMWDSVGPASENCVKSRRGVGPNTRSELLGADSPGAIRGRQWSLTTSREDWQDACSRLNVWHRGQRKIDARSLIRTSCQSSCWTCSRCPRCSSHPCRACPRIRSCRIYLTDTARRRCTRRTCPDRCSPGRPCSTRRCNAARSIQCRRGTARRSPCTVCRRTLRLARGSRRRWSLLSQAAHRCQVARRSMSPPPARRRLPARPQPPRPVA